MTYEPVLAARCDDNLNYLRTSATFAMSLGAKELFHTNFLAFLLESDGDSLAPLRGALRDALNFPVGDDEQSTCVVWREKKHMDLIVVPMLDGGKENDGPVLSRSRAHVIEAKLKSIPTRLQLEKYDAELAKGFEVAVDIDSNRQALWLGPPRGRKRPVGRLTKTLLTPNGDGVLAGWSPATWSKVAAAIEGAIPTDQASKGLRFVLEDYVKALHHIVALVAKASQLAREMCAGEAKYVEFLAETRSSEFAELRVKDLVSKVMYDVWLRALVPEFPHARESYVVYTNSNPGIGVDYELPLEAAGGALRVGVQIQDTEYRHYVAAVDDSDSLETWAMRPPLSTQWLSSPIKLGPLQGRQTPGANSDLRAFNRKRFVFRRARIEPDHTMNDVRDALLTSLNAARELVQGSELAGMLGAPIR